MLVQIKAKVGNAFPKLMTAAVLNSCYGLTSEQDIDEIEAFFRANPLPSNARSISQMLEVSVFEIESALRVMTHLLHTFISMVFRKNDRGSSLWKKSSLRQSMIQVSGTLCIDNIFSLFEFIESSLLGTWSVSTVWCDQILFLLSIFNKYSELKT